jgi:hypothetical protein
MVLACNPSYSGGRDWKIDNLRPVQKKIVGPNLKTKGLGTQLKGRALA